MSTKNSPTAENEALLKKVGALGEEVKAMKVAMRRASRTRLVLLLLLLALLAASIWMFYKLALQFGSRENRDLLIAKARERMNESATPAMNQFQAMVEHCQPVLTKAFSEQAQADMPKYTEVLNEQREMLVKNLQARLDERVRARWEAASDRYETILREEFPQVENTDLIVQMYASLEQIIEKLVEKHYSEEIRREVEGINDTWKNFEMADLPAQGETPLEQEFLAELLLLGHYRLKGQTILVPSADLVRSAE
jgi:multidrug efflux pump subunit AcrB